MEKVIRREVEQGAAMGATMGRAKVALVTARHGRAAVAKVLGKVPRRGQKTTGRRLAKVKAQTRRRRTCLLDSQLGSATTAAPPTISTRGAGLHAKSAGTKSATPPYVQHLEDKEEREKRIADFEENGKKKPKSHKPKEDPKEKIAKLKERK